MASGSENGVKGSPRETRQRLRSLAAVACLGLVWPVKAGAQTPDITGAPPSAVPLGELVKHSVHIAVLRLDKVAQNAQRTILTFTKTVDLKGRYPVTRIKHVIGSIGDSCSDRNRQALFDWAKPGNTALYFHDGQGSQTCLGNFWYSFRIDKPTQQAMYEELEEFSTTYVGPTEKLREHVAAVLAGREVVLTAQAKAEHNSPGREESPIQQDWLRGKKGRVWRLKASLKIDSEAVREDASRYFVGWGGGGPEAVPALVANLKSPDSWVRAEAIEDLGQIGPSARPALPIVRAALADLDGHVRVFAAEALARIAPEEPLVLPVLTAALEDDRPAIRNAAVAACVALSPRAGGAVPFLLAALAREPEAGLRGAMAFALGEIGRDAPVPGSVSKEVAWILARLLQHDAEVAVRRWAVRALVPLGSDGRAALPALRVALRDSGQNIPAIAADALARLGPFAIPLFDEALQDEACTVRESIAGYLGELGPRAGPTLPTLMGTLREKEPELRASAASALLNIDPKRATREVVPVLSSLVRQEALHNRQSAILALERLGPQAQDASPALLEALRGGSHYFRVMAAEALGTMRPPSESTTSTLRALLRDERRSVRVVAAQVLWQTTRQGRMVAPVLAEAVRDGRDWIGSTAASVLKELGPEARDLVPHLVVTLQSSKSDCRAHAALALGGIGLSARAAVPVLDALLRDRDLTVRLHAALALERIDLRQQEFVSTIRAALKHKDPESRFTAVAFLADRDNGLRVGEAVPLLTELLEDENARTRAEAADTLGRFGSAARPAVPALCKALNDTRLSVRTEVVRALYRIDPRHPALPPAVAQVVREHPNYSWPVLYMLGDLGPGFESSVPWLLRALRHEDHDVYLRALKALQQIDPAAVAQVWRLADLPAELGPTEASLSATQFEALWADLGSEEAPRGYRAVWKLVLAGTPVVPLLGQRLHSVPNVSPEHLGRLIADLDSARFAVRQKATTDLEQLEQAAEPALRQALANRPSLEARRRIEQLLKALDPHQSPERRRALRAVEALERIDSVEARRALERLAQGATGARLTQAAKAALARRGPARR
jgi:HEAT repeat protein